jgi:N-dimethylarginine dimethylaminohydrolase
MRTPGPGSEPSAALGGPGWQPRLSVHRDEFGPGRPWTACGYRSEVGTLRSVLLARPPDSISAVLDPASALFDRRVDVARMRVQADLVADAYRSAGIQVHFTDPGPLALPNIVFLRDLFFVTPEGAVIGRAATAQRSGEERYAAAALAALGIPILRTVTGGATFECADALWLDPANVVVGIGFRTSPTGAAVLAEVLEPQGVTVIPVPLGPGVQHLLGSLAFLDRDLVALASWAARPELRGLLRDRGYRAIELEPTPDVVVGRGMNVVALSPGRVLMPAGADSVSRQFRAAEVDVVQVEVGEYLVAAGGVGCLTGILHRDL